VNTIKQIADELGVSKQAVRRHINKLPPTEVSTNIHRAIVISDVGTEIIRDIVNRRTTNVTTNKVVTVDTIVTMLQNELNEKNALIKAQQQTISELTVALEHTTASLNAAQALHAGTIQKQLGNENVNQEKIQEPKSFFRKLFRTSKGI
jgi:predicted transcriptional regulator